MTVEFDIKNFKLVSQIGGVAIAQYIETETADIDDIEGSNFFNPVADQLGIGSVIFGSVSDGIVLLGVTNNASGVVTVTEMATTVDPTPTT